MRLLLDQGLPRSTVRHLSSAGIAAEHVGDLGLATAVDSTILQLALQQGATIVTLDADFHRLLAISRAMSPSVIRIRIEGLKGDQLATVISQVIATAGSELAAGAACSVTPNRIRVHLLPIGH
jgi:predicted nuclease of predicted toxin-antitoxin system